MQYASLMQNELQRFLLIEGYDITQIDFINPGSEVFVNDIRGNNSACNSADCNFFNYFNPQHIPRSAVDNNPGINPLNFNGDGNPIGNVIAKGVDNVGSDELEIIIYYGGIRTDVCEQINIINNVRSISGSPYMESIGGGSVAYQNFSSYAPNKTPPSSPNDLLINGSRASVSCSERELSGINYPASPNNLHIILYEQ